MASYRNEIKPAEYVETYLIELSPLSDGTVAVIIDADIVEQDDDLRKRKVIAAQTVPTMDDALAIVRNAVSNPLRAVFMIDTGDDVEIFNRC